MAKLTLIGLNNYTDGKIWDGLTTPSGFNKTTFINTIMLNYGEMETLYADPDMMAFAIKTWSDRNAWNMIKAITAISVQYNPLDNYDRHETRTTEGASSGSNTGTVTDAGTHSSTGTKTTESEVNTETSTTTDRDETNETEHKMSAYDSNSYSPDNTDDGSSTMDESVTGSGSSTGSGEEHTTTSGTTGNTRTDNLRHSDEHEETETIRAWGNIGVTTSQQMLKAELDLSLYNMYDTFAGVFAFDLLVMTY